MSIFSPQDRVLHVLDEGWMQQRWTNQLAIAEHDVRQPSESDFALREPELDITVLQYLYVCSPKSS